MRRLGSSLMACAMLVSLPGCMLELLGSTAIQSGLAAEGAGVSQRALQKTQSSVDESTLRSAVQAHYAEYGTFPPTLEVLVPQFIDGVPAPPIGFVWAYDATSGSLSVGQPMAQSQGQRVSPPTDEDYKNMRVLYDAIAVYGQNTGYYPNSLADLAPGYMASVPRTTSGKPFKYDPATGAVEHPYDVQQARQAQRTQQVQGGGRQAVGGGGPLGETLTGINMQQQLNGMNQSGVTGAGSAGRQNARDAGAQQNQRHEQAMRELGLQ